MCYLLDYEMDARQYSLIEITLELGLQEELMMWQDSSSMWDYVLVIYPTQMCHLSTFSCHTPKLQPIFLKILASLLPIIML